MAAALMALGPQSYCFIQILMPTDQKCLERGYFEDFDAKLGKAGFL